MIKKEVFFFFHKKSISKQMRTVQISDLFVHMSQILTKIIMLRTEKNIGGDTHRQTLSEKDGVSEKEI